MLTYKVEDGGSEGIDRVLDRARSLVGKGELIIYPTDTLYGLGAAIYNEDAIRSVFELKKRPFSQPISVALPDASRIEEVALFENDAQRGFVRELFPGKATVILPCREEVPSLLTGGSGRIGLRVPGHEFARRLLGATGPLTATSANIHGQPSPLTSRDIEGTDGLGGGCALIVKSEELDEKLGGRGFHSVKTTSREPGSTIVRLRGGLIEVLRYGEMKVEDIGGIGERWGMEIVNE